MKIQIPHRPFRHHGEIISFGKKTPIVLLATRANRTPEEADEGITGQKDKDGVVIDRAVSISENRVIDLLCEGEIHGLVDSEYIGEGTDGNIGWTRVREKRFAEIGLQGASNGIRWLPSVLWNELPILTKQTTPKLNYQQVDVIYGAGGPDGSDALGMDNSLTINRGIGERLRGGGEDNETFAKKYRINNVRCKGVSITVKIAQLMYQEKAVEDEYGDIRDTTVVYSTYYRKVYNYTGAGEQGWTFNETVEITGKLSSAYLKQSVVMFRNLPDINEEGFVGWEVKLVRTTADTLTTTIRNTTYVDSIAEIYGDVYSYPHSALVQQRFSSEFFQRVPDRQFDVRGIKVKVPADYNTILKTYGNAYDGVSNPYWKGNFKVDKEWTDNPAWIFYDLLTNKRYGLGKHIEDKSIDKWTLYDIAQYCDTMVPDGYGKSEPRFRCNAFIQSRDEAHKVINDLSSVFRGITYYAGNTIFAAQDRGGKIPVVAFTNANIENGDFTYSTSAKKSRHTVCIIKYRDERDNFRQKVEYVEDVDGIRKHGIRELELAGVGCTSRGQAQRFGKWALYSEQTDVETCSFATGLEAVALRPGDIISVSDANRTVKRYGGRTFSINTLGTEIILDTIVPLLAGGATYELTIMTPTFQYDTTIVEQEDGSGNSGINSTDIPNIRRSQLQTKSFSGVSHLQITGSDGITRTKLLLPTSLDIDNYDTKGQRGNGGGIVWMIQPTGQTATQTEENEKKLEKYRILNVEEKEDNRYVITSLEYNEEKFNRIDGTEGFDTDPVAVGVSSPAGCILTTNHLTENSVEIDFTVIPGDVTNVYTYQIYIKYGSPWAATDFVETDPSATVALDSIPDARYFYQSMSISAQAGVYFPTQNGKYYFRVYAANRLGVASPTSAHGDWVNPADNTTYPYVEIVGINPMHDVRIKALTIASATEVTQSELSAGTTFQRVHDEVEPTFTWSMDVAGTVPHVIFDYRLTFRPTSSGNNPSLTILHTEILTGLASTALSYKLTARKQIEIAHANNTMPYRNFDLVVEALEPNTGESSSGGFTTAGAASTKGYDILQVINPAMETWHLTPFDQVDLCGKPVDGIAPTVMPECSDQWLTSDGDVKILFTPSDEKRNLDAMMGVLFISEVMFNADGNLDLSDDEVLAANDIHKIVFTNNSNNPKGVDISMVNWKPDQAYIAVGFGDQLDNQLYQAFLSDSEFPASMSPVGQIASNASNTVRIEPRAATIDANIVQGAWKALIIGEWNGWGAGMNENPKNISVETQIMMSMPSFTIYRPMGYYWDHHGNGWGHPRAVKDAGPRHGTAPPLHYYWEKPGHSPYDFFGPDGGASCLRLGYPGNGYRGYAWSWEYILVMKFAFEGALSYNTYSLVWQWNNTQVGKGTRGKFNTMAEPEQMKIDTVQIDSIGELLEENEANPTEGLTYPLTFSRNDWNHDCNCCGGWGGSYNNDYISMKAKAYKAKDGVVVKMQVSDADKWLFEEGRQFMIGII
jgi:predicted phage tail protein